ncbi:MAG: L-fucose:H+ symporter permease [Bacteroidetes bacterium 4572_117]|nr:MAG: L-fucose:H+ symporter permease [Bacteroidetes bacterium 4572_117]
MNKIPLVPKNVILPFILLTTLFFAWAVPNNLTDTMLAAFKRIMSLSDTKTAWIQISCYLLGYGFFAIPGALFIKKYTYKAGVMLGLGLYALGAFLFFPAMLTSEGSMNLSFIMYLAAILILFAGLSILETSTNSYVLVIGPEQTATQRLNLAQSFNPFGAIAGVVISQIFVLSQLNTMSASERASVPAEELVKIQGAELNAVTMTYIAIGVVMLVLLLAIFLTKMPKLKEDDKNLDFIGTFRRLFKNKNYVWAIIAQFFYVGAQIAVWSFTIRYAMYQLNFDEIITQLGNSATTTNVIAALREIEPVAASFYNISEWFGLDVLLPRTAEQAGATYYILSLIAFVLGRFLSTAFMKYVKPRNLLTAYALIAVVFTLIVIYAEGALGVYALIGISACMSLMFPTIYGLGIAGLKDDVKIGGSGMIMAIAGAAFLTQIQGVVSDQSGSIRFAYWVPAIAFLIIAYYSGIVSKKR